MQPSPRALVRMIAYLPQASAREYPWQYESGRTLFAASGRSKAKPHFLPPVPKRFFCATQRGPIMGLHGRKIGSQNLDRACRSRPRRACAETGGSTR